MNDRSVEIILTEWRAAELALAVDDSDPPSQEVADRAERLRAEYAEAIEARQNIADELASSPTISALERV